MTRQEILALSAGRELDRLVAEHVLGWTDFQYPTHLTSAIDGLTAIAPDPTGGNCWGRRYVEQFSSRISSAWQVIDHLIQRGYWVEINLPGGKRSKGDLPEVTLYTDFWEQEEADVVEMGETLPLVICRAALLTSLGKRSVR